MKRAEEYAKRVEAHVEAIRREGGVAIIHGAGRAGWYVKRVLEHFGVRIAAYSDNRPEAHPGGYFDCVVRSPADLVADFPRAYVVVAVFVSSTADGVTHQLRNLGWRAVYHDMPAFLYVFLVEVAGRQCDHNVLADSIHMMFQHYELGPAHYGYTPEKFFVSPFVTSVITQKCSLRCRDCGQLIPYYQRAVNFTSDAIVADLKQYARAFDVVPEISLHGGEPFLHPAVGRICREVSAIPNIVFVSFVTNGTLLPSEETLRILASSGADVHVSGGYGELSGQLDAVLSACSVHGVFADVLYCSEARMWTRPAAVMPHRRSVVANDEIFGKCVATNLCCQIMDGQLHRCPFSMHGSHQGRFLCQDSDFVRLHDSAAGVDHGIGTIRSFLTRKSALSVCDYCDPSGATLVPPAIQLSRSGGSNTRGVGVTNGTVSAVAFPSEGSEVES